VSERDIDHISEKPMTIEADSTDPGFDSESASTAPLVEGRDYYLESGFIVFTAGYHLRRGYCCDSGCRHCPYDRQPADSERQKPDR